MMDVNLDELKGDNSGSKYDNSIVEEMLSSIDIIEIMENYS